MANHEDIYVDQGASFTAEITVKKDNVNLDLTNYTYEGQIRKTFNSETVVVSFTLNQSEDINRPHVLVASLSPADTALLTALRYVYDIEITSTDSDADVYRVIQGYVHVSKNVTRDS